MTATFTLVLCSLLLVDAPGPTSQPAAQATSQPTVATLAPFVGEWAIEATWEDGRALQARNVYAWMLGGKHLSAQTFVGPRDRELQRYEGVMTWHSKQRCLAYFGFAVDGGVTEYRVETTDGKVFRIGFAPLHEGEEPQVRQTIRFLNADAYTWEVEIRQDGQWKRIMMGTWKRLQQARDDRSELMEVIAA